MWVLTAFRIRGEACRGLCATALFQEDGKTVSVKSEDPLLVSGSLFSVGTCADAEDTMGVVCESFPCNIKPCEREQAHCHQF